MEQATHAVNLDQCARCNSMKEYYNIDLMGIFYVEVNNSLVCFLHMLFPQDAIGP